MTILCNNRRYDPDYPMRLNFIQHPNVLNFNLVSAKCQPYMELGEMKALFHSLLADLQGANQSLHLFRMKRLNLSTTYPKCSYW
eukprot:scaffold10568_cov140-Skeletonema_dohrnii-CCMP3373.AAC.1